MGQQLSSVKNVQKVLSGMRISIPESYTKKWRIHEGDLVILVEKGGCLRIIPADVVEKTR